jgi:hypothetical protein
MVRGKERYNTINEKVSCIPKHDFKELISLGVFY